jgi:hypothetical protein
MTDDISTSLEDWFDADEEDTEDEGGTEVDTDVPRWPLWRDGGLWVGAE